MERMSKFQSWGALWARQEAFGIVISCRRLTYWP